MNCIVAVTNSWAIGRDGGMLFHLPEDLKYFRRTTLGHVLVMGRKTLDSFPGGRPLKDRRNIVLTRDATFAREGVEVCHSLEELLTLLADIPQEDIFVVGGGQIYQLLLPFCQRAYVTHIEADSPAQVYFPDLSTLPGWALTVQGEPLEQDGIVFRFCVYEKTKA